MSQAKAKSIEVQLCRTVLLLLLLFLTACGGGEGTPLGPQVMKTDPGNKAGNVPVDASIRATFSYDMDPVTVNKETFIVVGAEGTVRYEDRTAIFTPTGRGFQKGREYNAILTSGVKDLDGIPLPSNFIWSFVTAGDARLSVAATVPEKNDENISVHAVIEVIFSKPVNPATVQNSQNFFIAGVETESIRYVEAERKAILDPKGPLNLSTSYTVTVTKGVQALDGELLASDYVWSFKTEAVPDTQPPILASRVPGQGETNVPVGTNVELTFSESVEANSVRSGVSLMTSLGEIVPGAIQPTGNSVIFDPTDDLRLGTEYRVTVSRTVQDQSGNPMGADEVWSFTTEPGPDEIKPTVTALDPQPFQTGVSVKRPIRVTFSEPMKKESVENSNHFLVTQGGLVAGVISYTSQDLVGVFTPSERLNYDTVYSVLLSDGMRDQADNQLNPVFWQFTTTSPPRVDEKQPLPGEENVGAQREIAARFSRQMNPATFVSGFEVVQLSPGTGPVAGSVRYDAITQTAFFTPTLPLESGALYQVTLSTAVEDSDQNPLEQPEVWGFRTVSAQITPPQVLSTDPASGAGNVPTVDFFGNAISLRATFNKAIQPASVQGSFLVEKVELDSTRRAISGAVQPHPSDPTTFFFTPNPALERGSMYEAKLTTGITDLEGNRHPSDHIWSFTTAP